MEVTIDWRWTTTMDDPCWQWDKALYAHFVDDRLIYVGKAETATVMQRLMARDKAKLRQEVYAEIEGNLRRTKVLVGRPKGSPALRATKMVLRDLEGLFIRELKPERSKWAASNPSGWAGVIRDPRWSHPGISFCTAILGSKAQLLADT